MAKHRGWECREPNFSLRPVILSEKNWQNLSGNSSAGISDGSAEDFDLPRSSLDTLKSCFVEKPTESIIIT